MKQLFLLSGENLKLARDEVLALIDGKQIISDGKVLVVENSKERLFTRLGLTHAIYRFLFSCDEKDLENEVKKFNWQEFYDDSYCVRRENGIKSKEAEIASWIWETLDKPKVDLKYCRTKIEFIKVENKVYCGILLNMVKKDFLKRKSHLRPALHPTSLNPRIARAMINLTGIEKGDLYDPFCGSGGILIEAGLMRFKTVGCDVDKIVLAKAKENLEYYGVRYVYLEERDALTLTKKLDYVVTDLPYGRASKITDEIFELYMNFLRLLKRYLKHKAVIGFPDNVDYKTLIKNMKLKLIEEYDVYLHKSLSKKIVLIEN